MIEDTSSRRAEWYEADYEPDDPEELDRQKRLKILHGLGISITQIRPADYRNVTINNPKIAGKTLLIKQVDKAGKASASAGTHGMPSPMDIVMNQMIAYGTAVSQAADALVKAFTSFSKALKPVLDPNDYTLSPGESETVKERALRLAKRPHSMAPRDGKNFTRHGNKKQ